MMVDLSVIIHLAGLHPGVEQHLNKGDQQGKDQPDINHLYIGGGGKGCRYTVVSTRRAVRLTVTTASKKKPLKKFVA